MNLLRSNQPSQLIVNLLCFYNYDLVLVGGKFVWLDPTIIGVEQVENHLYPYDHAKPCNKESKILIQEKTHVGLNLICHIYIFGVRILCTYYILMLNLYKN